ncbi:short chain dehydrogenase [Saccharicrinis sp. FJH54]|uniref:short chain dehydrogenase n=1 Tax=Saccharicrinis sp. FJH54 TaxID=3344665 RepID=UPI0035D4077A
MKIIIIGGYGTIGNKVAAYLKQRHDVIIAGRSAGNIQIDITDNASIKSALEKTGKVDAIVNIAGATKWGSFADLTEEDYYVGIKSKLMGQVNLVRIGREYLNRGGSITLTTGILADDPVVNTTAAAMVNGGIHSFVKAVNLEIENEIRINAVSVGMVEDAYERIKNAFPGHIPVTMNEVVQAYVRSVEGKDRGEIIRRY